MLNAIPLQVLAVAELVTKGAGFTVTVIGKDGPVQPADEIGVIMYCTVPAVALFGLVRT